MELPAAVIPPGGTESKQSGESKQAWGASSPKVVIRVLL